MEAIAIPAPQKEKRRKRLSSTISKLKVKISGNLKAEGSSGETECSKEASGTERVENGHVHTEATRTTSTTTTIEIKETSIVSRPVRPPQLLGERYTVSDWERERFQRMVLGMSDSQIRRANGGRGTYDVEVLW